MLSPADIEKMSVGERLEAIELLWKSVTASGAPIDSPSWHGNVIAERIERIAEGKATFLTIEELKTRLRR